MTTTTIHPDMQVLIDAGKAAGEESSDDNPAAARRGWTIYSQAFNRPHPEDMAVHDDVVPTADNQVDVRVYRPAGADGPRPCVIYVHGGGFLVGDLDSSDSIAWGYAQGTGAVVVSANYRKTPEHPYPAAFNDIYGVLEYVAGHGDQFGIDAARIAIAGDSAAACLAARDRDGPKVVAQAPIYPGTGLDQTYPSYIDNAETPTLTTAGTKMYRQLYLANDLGTEDPYARPVLATDFSNLPPAWVHSAEIDPIRDDGRVYASKLALAGNDVTYREARGMIHGFLRARFTGDAARAEFDAICGFLKLHLGG
jgi:acetyl esterase